MASALVEYARFNSVQPKPDDVPEFLIFPGEGVYGQIDGKDIFVGNKRIVRRALSEEGLYFFYVIYFINFASLTLYL